MNVLSTGRKRAQRLYTDPSHCRKCGSTSELHRHHVDHNTMNNSPENVMILCAVCHGKLHAAERWKGHMKEKACAQCAVVFTYKRARETHCSARCSGLTSWDSRRQIQTG